MPAGSYAYKVAIDGSWDENYGAGGAPGGADIPLVLDAPQDVTFYYDHPTHWVTSDAEGPIVTARRQLPVRARLRGRLVAGLHARRG